MIMMIELNTLTFIKYFISAFTCCFGVFLTGTIILNKNIKKIKKFDILTLIVGSIFILQNSLLFDNIFKIFGTILILLFVFKITYKLDTHTSLVVTIITYIIFALSEAIFILFLGILELILDFSLIIGTIKTFFGNIVVASISIGIAFIMRKKINNYLQKITKANIIYTIILGVISVFTVLASIFKLYTTAWKIDYIFFLNILMVLGCITLIMELIKQYIKNREIVEKYQLIEEYIKTSAEVVEKYGSTIHKYKNNLIVIKGYLNSDIKKANEYVDRLLDNYKDKKYNWFNKINYINIDSFRYLIYYKLTKAEEKNLKISVNVSPEIKKITDLDINQYDINILLDMIGEYFDNAIYAASESSEKELNLDLFLNDNKYIFILSNTYKENFDIKLINKNGYTTKGKGHGLGLYEIDKIIKKSKFIDSSYEVVDNYFVVNLTLNIIKQVEKKEE